MTSKVALKPLKSEFLALRSAIQKLVRRKSKKSTRQSAALTVSEQPFDDLLVARSKLYRRSRQLYLSLGGRIDPVFSSSPRMLSSPTLLEPKIQYTPVQSEMIWAATDASESKNIHHLMTLRTYVGSLFHEQNHRILWKILPRAPRHIAGLRKYLNFAESLVISADMALGDELGPDLAGLLYLTGTIYDPGTDVRRTDVKRTDVKRQRLSRRQYRNYLQATVHATYLNLEFYDPKDVERAILALFPVLDGPKGGLASRAARRSSRLDRSFVWKTNPVWQKKHRKWILSELSGPAPLILPDHPLDNRQQYLLTEKWFEALGL